MLWKSFQNLFEKKYYKKPTNISHWDVIIVIRKMKIKNFEIWSLTCCLSVSLSSGTSLVLLTVLTAPSAGAKLEMLTVLYWQVWVSRAAIVGHGFIELPESCKSLTQTRVLDQFSDEINCQVLIYVLSELRTFIKPELTVKTVKHPQADPEIASPTWYDNVGNHHINNYQK